MLSVRSASIKFKPQSKSRSNWKERPSDPPQRTETHSGSGTSDYEPLNAQLAPRGVDLKDWPVKGPRRFWRFAPIVNASALQPLTVVAAQKTWQQGCR